MDERKVEGKRNKKDAGLILQTYRINFLESFEMATENPFLGPNNWGTIAKSQGFRSIEYLAAGDSIMNANVAKMKKKSFMTVCPNKY